MNYKYSAKTSDGLATKKGIVEAANTKDAASFLIDRGLIVYSLIPVNEGMSVDAFFASFSRVSLNDMVKLTEQLSNMITAGLPLTKSLEMLVSQAHKKKLQEILVSILEEIEAGSQLSKSMEKYPHVFDDAYVSLIKAGEASGQLGIVLKKLAETLEKQRQFKAKIVGAMIYPAIVMLAMIGAFTAIIIFVIPQMAQIYDSFDIELPFTTIALIKTSNFTTAYWYVVLFALAGIIALQRGIANTNEGKYVFAKIYMKIPLIGSLIRQSNIVSFARVLGLLIQSGVPIVDGLNIVKDSMSNVIYRDSVQFFIEDVKHGYPLSQSMNQDKNFPQLANQMVLIGEETGTLDQRLFSISEYYEGEVDKVVKNLSTAVEPLIMIALGAMVALLIFSVILPIYQLTSSF